MSGISKITTIVYRAIIDSYIGVLVYSGGGIVSWHTAPQDGGSGFDFRYGAWKFSTDLFHLSIFSSPGVHSVITNFHRGTLQPAFRADSSAILVVPNDKVRMEAQHTIPCLIPHDLLWESLFLLLEYSTYTLKNESGDSKRPFFCT
jgi:hypothetical protein